MGNPPSHPASPGARTRTHVAERHHEILANCATPEDDPSSSMKTETPSERPIRILYIIDYWGSPGGTERHLSYLLEMLDRRRFECSVVIFDYRPNALVDRAR